ncbi:hypothetical protein ACIODT_30595 [Streptomyces sp. NPDC088251]|uniref:hypothetical protein n=1 Tax=unclassified Streptomyces TaxID=2593676 RepID=UPI0038018E7A
MQTPRSAAMRRDRTRTPAVRAELPVDEELFVTAALVRDVPPKCRTTPARQRGSAP